MQYEESVCFEKDVFSVIYELMEIYVCTPVNKLGKEKIVFVVNLQRKRGEVQIYLHLEGLLIFKLLYCRFFLFKIPLSILTVVPYSQLEIRG